MMESIHELFTAHLPAILVSLVEYLAVVWLAIFLTLKWEKWNHRHINNNK